MAAVRDPDGKCRSARPAPSHQNPLPIQRLVLAILFVLALPHLTLASLLAQRSYTQLSPDGHRLLVMLSIEDKTDALLSRLPDGRSIDARAVFFESGVYDASTLAPVWQIKWYAFPGELCWSDDFVDVARLNRFAVKRGPAVSFFHAGKLTRQYNCDELLTGLRGAAFLPYSTSDWHSRWYEHFGRRGSEVALSTARREFWTRGHQFDLGLEEFYTFDLASGAITSRRVTGAWYAWVYGAALLAILASPVVMLVYGRKALKAIRARSSSRRGLCAKCGYDLRASNGACPECGQPIPTREGPSTSVDAT